MSELMDRVKVAMQVFVAQKMLYDKGLVKKKPALTIEWKEKTKAEKLVEEYNKKKEGYPSW